MQEQITQLEQLMHLYSPAQVAVWLGLADPRPIHQWILRNKIPRTKEVRVKDLLRRKVAANGGVVRRSKRKKERTV